MKAALALGKPLLLDEFGKLVPRDDFFTSVLNVNRPLHALVLTPDIYGTQAPQHHGTS